MNNPPRINHFIPQFWIKRFTAADGKIWAYDRDDGRVRPRSPKALMQLFNLYTVQPTGVDDTTLETVDLDKIDREGNAAFDRVLNGDHSEAARKELATFLAAQIMRDPEIVTSYNPKAQELSLSLLEIFDATDYETFARKWGARFPGACIEKQEYDHIRSLGIKDGEGAIEKLITALDASGGLPELPFTDVVRNADGRDKLCDQLLKFDWLLKIDTNAGLVLGDTGVLYEKGRLADGVKVPLSSSAALHLALNSTRTPGIRALAVTPGEVDALNLESAARARRWLVGEPSLLEKLKPQVGSSSLPSN